ncbi:MAG: OB-fold nucleic acid binding domain-containing protein [Candidatus Helarchaeota archaeon]|nr:OB-fold nucleic acid binding domain-containing protein [Candidatus Helarchaeota archaeon]
MNSEPSKSLKRAIALKLSIHHILSGTFVKADDKNYLETSWGGHVSRVHIFGTIVRKWVSSTDSESKSDRTPQASITVDDGTETIRLKAWKDDIKIFEDFQIGNIIDVIGHIREYKNEKYIAPEIIKTIENPNWELIHELNIIESLSRVKSNKNLQKISADAQQISEKAQQITPKDSEHLKSDHNQKSIFKDEIVELIRKLDVSQGTSKSQGISKNQLKTNLKIPEIDFENALTDLINEGTIYQPSPGKFKIL